jgi:uncharacterized lipoprotein YmbA
MTHLRTAACCVLIALAGCASGVSPRTSYYTLAAETAPTSSPPGASTTVRISVGRAAIPEMVDRPQMVVRSASNQVEISDFNRWGEPLRDAIPRVVAENLAQKLGPRYTVVAGGMRGAVPEVRILLDVQKLDAALGGGVTLDVLWGVRSAGGARDGRSVIEDRASGSGYAGVAAAYSRALARVAQDIAAAIEAQPNQPEG